LAATEVLFEPGHRSADCFWEAQYLAPVRRLETMAEVIAVGRAEQAAELRAKWPESHESGGQNYTNHGGRISLQCDPPTLRYSIFDAKGQTQHFQ